MVTENDLQKIRSSGLGVYCTSSGSESYIYYEERNLGKLADMGRAELLDAQAKVFHHYLWGPDGHSGLSARFKNHLSGDYGKDISLVLLRFNVNPLPNWPAMKDVDNYRPSEKSIGAWITIDDEYFSLPDDAAKERFVRDRILDRLETISKRFKARKLDADIDRLIDDVKKIF
ncbi:hypothetical protein IPM09_01920 [Candidatus Saccharibacteria bacterium]|nr:MAG: hypothetical protein IPM09_01920 [Candidatus Saccharibacteria bacterium]